VKTLHSLFTAAAFGLGLCFGMAATTLPSVAQTAPAAAPAPPADTVCGTWQNDLWVPSGQCGFDPACGAMVSGTWTPNGTCRTERRDTVSGTITIVKGHLVTLQRSKDTVVINDQPALNSQTTGRIAVGRNIVAAGYWRDGTFYATSITSPPEQGGQP